MTKIAGYRCDHCGASSGRESLPVGWFRVQWTRDPATDDYVDVGHFCSERCMVAKMKRIKSPAPPLKEGP